jgi:FG-GAP repeat protein/VCBS repeat protein
VLAPHFKTADGRTGKAYLFTGSDVGLSASGWSFAGFNPAAGDSDFPPHAVASAGDVNGDGFADILVAAPAAGVVYAFYGSADGPSAVPDWSVQGTPGEFGAWVASAGDVNKDAFADILIGNPAAAGTGEARLYPGSPQGLSYTSTWQSHGDGAAGARFGTVSTAGDVNHDGYSDVVIGAPGGSGAAFLFLGSASGLSAIPAWKSGGASDSLFGWSVAGGIDIDQDGFSDILIGAPAFEGHGKVYAFYGFPGGLTHDPVWTSQGARESGSRFGFSVAGIGNGDFGNFHDVVVGAPGTPDQGNGTTLYFLPGQGPGSPPPPRNLIQSAQPDGPPVDPGFQNDASTMSFRAEVSHPSGERATVWIEVEVQSNNLAFDGTRPVEGTKVPGTGGVSQATVSGLSPGPYHWRARCVDYIGQRSPWVAYHPQASPDFWIGPPSSGGTLPPPELNPPADLVQSSHPGGEARPVGFVDDDPAMAFRADVMTAGATAWIEVEVKPNGTAFDGAAARQGTLVDGASGASEAVFTDLADDAYHWRARAADASGKRSGWVEFDSNPSADFAISSAGAAPPTPEPPAVQPSPPAPADPGTPGSAGTAGSPGKKHRGCGIVGLEALLLAALARWACRRR